MSALKWSACDGAALAKAGWRFYVIHRQRDRTWKATVSDPDTGARPWPLGSERTLREAKARCVEHLEAHPVPR